MSLTMFDSVTWEDIPADARMVAGYIDGDFAWPREAWARWPHAVKVLITVTGDLLANVYDIERGDGTSEQAAEWIRRKQAAGHKGATIYCARSSLDDVYAACRGLSYYVWVADWTGEPHPVPDTVATQYVDAGNRYDATVVYSGAWVTAVDAANRPWPLAA